MIRVGLVDHHLNNFHANKFVQLLHGPLAELGARVVCAWESDPVGEDWCARTGIARVGSAEAAAESCDAVMVLAPDNVETHRVLCSRVFPAGRPVFVDKYLAPTTEDARAILAEADRYNVNLYSSSSLRFAMEHRELWKPGMRPSEAFARGMGDWMGYGVHTVALLQASLGSGAARVLDSGSSHASVVTVEYRDGRRGWIEVREAANQWEVFPWTFGFRDGERYVTGTVRDYEGFYSNLMREVVSFFGTQAAPPGRDAMVETVAILEAAGESRMRGGEWVALDQL
ncbi:MAG: hypothetical protein FJX77_17260 [Armatimonadetes bacterium]|nr:hypothetical protein [Armatimonadota bacterium]